ncbi:MAG: hypothetical protein ACK5N9_19005, partial [Pirellula sp.]
AWPYGRARLFRKRGMCPIVHSLVSKWAKSGWVTVDSISLNAWEKQLIGTGSNGENQMFRENQK